eukprot:Gb_22842 [translate_table: standard]
MSRPHDVLTMFSSCGNPLRKRSSKLDHMLINAFESALTERLKKLKAKDLISLAWTHEAMEVLSATHMDLKSLILHLQFPATQWDANWVDEYLDDSANLLDICLALNAEISKLEQAQLLVLHVLHVLEFSPMSSDKLFRAKDSLQDLMEQTQPKRMKGKTENYSVLLQSFSKNFQLGRMKSSAKGMVLMRSLYAVKAMSIFVCSAVASVLWGSAALLMDTRVSENLLWSASFMGLQKEISEKLKSELGKDGCVRVVKELQRLDAAVGNVYSMLADVPNGKEAKRAVEELQKSAELVGQGLDPLHKQFNHFFQIVVNGRNALLDCLRPCAK